MMLGIVTIQREAYLPLRVIGPRDQIEVTAVIDTGFNGWLSLPSQVIASLGLRWRRRARAELADGTSSVFDVFIASVIWDNATLTIPVDRADTDPLIGMSLLWGFDLHVRVALNGPVTIARI